MLQRRPNGTELRSMDSYIQNVGVRGGVRCNSIQGTIHKGRLLKGVGTGCLIVKYIK